MTPATPDGAVPAPAPAPSAHLAPALGAPCTVWHDGAYCGATPTVRFVNARACRDCCARLGLPWSTDSITPGQWLRDQRAAARAAREHIATLLNGA